MHVEYDRDKDATNRAKHGVPLAFGAVVLGTQGRPTGAESMATVKVTPALIQEALQKTDWAAVDAQTDEDIARHVASDPDAAPILSEAETAAAITRSVRKRLGLSQAAFAARYHVPIGTLRDWEQNRKQPDAPALAYLHVIAREPDMVARALRRQAA